MADNCREQRKCSVVQLPESGKRGRCSWCLNFGVPSGRASLELCVRRMPRVVWFREVCE